MVLGNINGADFDCEETREIAEETACKLASRYGFDFMEVNCRDASSVERVFTHLTRAMILSQLKQQCTERQGLSRTPNPTGSLRRTSSLMVVKGASKTGPKRKPNIAKAFRDECDVLLKVLLVGEASVGKTSLMCRFVHKNYNNHYRTTVGIDFESHVLQVDDNSVKIQIWDTAGQEKFKSLSPQYYRGADVIVVVYDVSSRHSFDRVLSWAHSVQMVSFFLY